MIFYLSVNSTSSKRQIKHQGTIYSTSVQHTQSHDFCHLTFIRTQIQSLSSVYSCGIMSDKSELKAELERKKQRLAQIREEKKRKEEERKKKEVCTNLCNIVNMLLGAEENLKGVGSVDILCVLQQVTRCLKM